jgi:hypothetical protein
MGLELGKKRGKELHVKKISKFVFLIVKRLEQELDEFGALLKNI